MYKIIFQNGKVRYFEGNATIQELNEVVSTYGRIIDMKRVEAKPKRHPRSFRLDQIIVTDENE